MRISHEEKLNRTVFKYLTRLYFQALQMIRFKIKETKRWRNGGRKLRGNEGMRKNKQDETE